MITLGIDLASQPKDTAACRIDWTASRPGVEELEAGCDDERLDELIAASDAIGIDAPFGWPQPFLRSMADWQLDRWDNTLRDQLTLRRTDVHVTRVCGLRPLRVAADRIALPALRNLALLHRHGVTDRSGPPGGRFFEVYPAGSLKQWQLLSPPGYRGRSPSAGKRRTEILQALKDRFRFSGGETAVDSDHLLDALVASLTASLPVEGRTLLPPENDLAAARDEGWIHLPAV